MRFMRSFRFCRVAVLFAIGVGLASGQASAKLPDVAPVLDIQYVNAIHRPTGCITMLEFSGETLLGASITDPLCLPDNIKSRSIPAFKRDFHVPASKRQLLRVR